MGVVIFLIVLSYVLANVYMYVTKPHLTIYEVQKGTTMDDTVATGVILRNEKVVKTKMAGYVNYYKKEEERVAKKSTLYSIDANKDVYDMLENSEEKVEFSSKDIRTIRNEISRFQSKYSDSDFKKVTEFKYDIENTATEVLFNHAMDRIQELMKEKGLSSSFKLVKAKNSGVLTYYMDGYEGLKETSITPELYKEINYKEKQLRSTELIAKGEPVCKIVINENWSIITLLSDKQYEVLKELERVKITILKNNFTCTVPIETYQSQGAYYAKLSMNKYMIQYLNDRFLEIEFHESQERGLKIPKSSLVEKDFYKIPIEMFSTGGGQDSNTLGITKETYDNKSGEVSYKFIETKIFYQTEEHYYIDARLFEAGTKIRSPKTQQSYTIAEKEQLQGVFNVNNGYAVFNRIEVLKENEEYCIIRENTEKGLSVYDHIALVGSTAIEEVVIY